MRTLTLAPLPLFASLLLGCGGDAASPAPTPAPDGTAAPEAPAAAPAPEAPATPTVAATAESLQQFIVDLRAVIAAKDTAKAATITRSIIPSEGALKKAIADDATEVLAKVTEMYHGGEQPTDAQLAGAFAGRPNQTVVAVHGATPAEIAAQSTEASKEFPGGAVDAAKQGVLRTDVTFYEIELLEPGKDAGIKFHLFFHDGEGWRMLGKVWRALPR